MRVTLVEGRCEGHGMCGLAAPDVFGLDDEGFVSVLQEQVSGDQVAQAQSGVRSCPVAALTAVDA